MKEKICFIINPIAGTRRKDTWPDIIRERINSERFDVNIVFTERAGHAFEIAREQAQQGTPYVVAVGGDGTVNEIASALRDSSTALGIIPSGSGNGLARHLSIPLKMDKALALINQAHIEAIDYGLADGKAFFCTLGTGLDAHVSDLFAHAPKRGLWTYVSIIAHEFFTYRPQHYLLRSDRGEEEVDAVVLTIANAAQYGNNAYIAPLADISDGLLDVCIIRKFPKIFTLGLALRLMTKRLHRSRYFSSFKCSQIQLIRQSEGAAHRDGDPFRTGRELNISIVRHGLHVITKSPDNV